MRYNSKRYAFLLKENPWRLKKTIRYLNPQPSERILEIGCNRGHYTKRVQAIAPESYGIDINPEAISHGVTHNLSVMDAENLQFPDESFDKIYSLHTIEHIPNIQKALKEMARVLRTEGKIVLAYPVEPIRGLFALRGAILCHRNLFYARNLHLHKLSPGKIAQLISDTPLRPIISQLSFSGITECTIEYFTVLQKEAKT